MGKAAQTEARESRRVIGADPGQTTGLAYIRGHTILETMALRHQRDIFQTLMGWVQSGDDAGELVEGIGLERFGNLQFLSPERHSSLMAEGTIRTVAAVLGVPVEDHTPEMISIYTRNKCVRLQEVFGSLPETLHERDALAHALLLLQKRPPNTTTLRQRREKAVTQ